jgi:hypothetical protein
MYATLLKAPLRLVVDRWKYGGESAFQEMAAEYREKHRLFLKNLAEETP